MHTELFLYLLFSLPSTAPNDASVCQWNPRTGNKKQQIHKPTEVHRIIVWHVSEVGTADLDKACAKYFLSSCFIFAISLILPLWGCIW